MSALTLSVSVAQITCVDGQVEQNLLHASELASEARQTGPAGREIIRLMEFQGYMSYTLSRQRRQIALAKQTVK